MTFNAPIDKVWDATIAALTEMGATIGTINIENGVLNTQEILVDPRRANDLVRTSAIFYGSYFGCKYQLNILEKSIDKNQTKVTVVSRIQVQRGIASSAGVSKNWYAIQSNGLLEKTLFDKIQKNL